MKIIDITGPICDGMWDYGLPFPPFKLQKLPKVEWLKDDVYCEIFGGLNSQTGTYLETPAHFWGNDKAPLMADIPLEKLVHIPCAVLMVDKPFDGSGRQAITPDDLQKAAKGLSLRPGEALLVGTGWGKKWMDDDYLSRSPYFTYEAMMWLLAQKPALLGSDFPRWENLEQMEGFFPAFYRQNILMLAPCVALEEAGAGKCRLTALPLKILGTSCIPCRAFLEKE